MVFASFLGKEKKEEAKMELALSLGDASTPFTFIDKTPKTANKKDLGFCMALGNGFSERSRSEEKKDSRISNSADPPVQLDLLPFGPVPRTQSTASSKFQFPWLAHNMVVCESGSSEGPGKGLDVNRLPVIGTTEETEDGAALSSPNSTVSSFHMDFGIKNGRRSRRDMEVIETERASSRASDDEENGSTRKKLRLSKDQSAFLEESFKEHSTLNPKQKVALAKQLNLRPRQVEVWFQNRRARTKLKQTEVDCEYLKRCCETLTEENRRIQKEVQELRALKTSQPFYMQLPATTLTMCPSCERVATTNNVSSTPSAAVNAVTMTTSPLAKPRTTIHHHPFSHVHVNKAAAS